jgi:DNA-binding CsgD family transcriptional regulator
MHESSLGRESMDNPMRLVLAMMSALNRSLQLSGAPSGGAEEGRVTPVPAGGFACDDAAVADFAGAEGGLFPGSALNGLEQGGGEPRACGWGVRRYFDVLMQQEQLLAMPWGAPPGGWSGSSRHQENLRRSDWAREALSLLAPVLASALCKSYVLCETLARNHQLVEALSLHQKIGSIVVKLPSHELMYSERAITLLNEWFPPQERETNGLPTELQERLKVLAKPAEGDSPGQRSWRRTGPSKCLSVSFAPLPGEELCRPWVLLLEEAPLGVPMPLVWRKKLTPREAEVVERALQYLDNRDIGQQLGCTEATVKKHMQRAFEKLGVENRNMLLYWAVRR